MVSMLRGSRLRAQRVSFLEQMLDSPPRPKILVNIAAHQRFASDLEGTTVTGGARADVLDPTGPVWHRRIGRSSLSLRVNAPSQSASPSQGVGFLDIATLPTSTMSRLGVPTGSRGAWVFLSLSSCHPPLTLFLARSGYASRHSSYSTVMALVDGACARSVLSLLAPPAPSCLLSGRRPWAFVDVECGAVKLVLERASDLGVRPDVDPASPRSTLPESLTQCGALSRSVCGEIWVLSRGGGSVESKRELGLMVIGGIDGGIDGGILPNKQPRQSSASTASQLRSLRL
ncbi:hypothetical protein FB45DRAFT_122723 [Roridomyces roridus]|uniref:Uncharacterized protein n=1 Tax=Roridomyces roridus TaxID=1738132 RepID=A0AAD7FG67_9AGAR|nr:hypothetical protein FB45DRAFT_122723 [Roridomyces roridus]